jgi:hypothetical protein
LIQLATNGIPVQRIITYVRSKFGYYWFIRGPVVKDSDPRVVERKESDEEMRRKRMDTLYPDGLDEGTFLRYARELDRIFEMAQRRHARMIVAFAPTLLEPEPGAPRAQAFLAEAKNRYPIEVYDFTNALDDYGLFADHDHLNSRGFRYFVKQYLEPILTGPPPARETQQVAAFAPAGPPVDSGP